LHNKTTLYVKKTLQDDWNDFIPKPFKDNDFFPVIERVLVAAKNRPARTNDDAWAREKRRGIESQSEQSTKENNSGAEENVADWSLKKEWSAGGTENADWSLKKKDAGWDNLEKLEDKSTLDYLKKEKQKRESEKVEDEDFDQTKYKKIKIKRVLNFNEIVCDVFIKLSSKKYIKIINKEEKFDHEHVIKYMNKNIRYLYVHVESYQSLMNSFSNLVMKRFEQVIKTNKSGPLRTMAELSSYQMCLDQARELGIDENMSKNINEAIEANLKTLTSDTSFSQLLKNIQNAGPYLAGHSLLLSFVCGKISSQTEWNTRLALQKLALASMLHDAVFESDDFLIQIREITPELKKELSKKDYEKVFEHPTKAGGIVANAKNLVPDVDTIIAQHHETPDGTGFPRGISALNISPLSTIFIIAEDFVDRVFGKKTAEIDMEKIHLEFESRYRKGNFKKSLDAFIKAFPK
jgi:HD-GYP domain-containing protein (c-di-GMP phosphodiesterase class II)